MPNAVESLVALGTRHPGRHSLVHSLVLKVDGPRGLPACTALDQLLGQITRSTTRADHYSRSKAILEGFCAQVSLQPTREGRFLDEGRCGREKRG